MAGDEDGARFYHAPAGKTELVPVHQQDGIPADPGDALHGRKRKARDFGIIVRVAVAPDGGDVVSVPPQQCCSPFAVADGEVPGALAGQIGVEEQNVFDMDPYRLADFLTYDGYITVASYREALWVSPLANLENKPALGATGDAMKINIEIDLTPEEFRKLMGWPDVQGFQNEIFDQIRNNMVTGVEGYDPLSVMQPYLMQSAGAMDAFQKLMSGFVQAYSEKGSKEKKE